MFAWPYLQSHMGMFTQQAGTSPSKSAHWATAATEGGVKVHLHGKGNSFHLLLVTSSPSLLA